MSKTCVLREPDGRLCGYVLQRGEQLLCRIGRCAGADYVTVIDANGMAKEYPLPSNHTEVVWRNEGGELTEAYLTAKNTQTTAMENPDGKEQTDPREKSAVIEAKTDSIERIRKEQKENTFRSEKENRAAKEETQIQKTLPGRRWPPPVLMMQGEYKTGKWLPEP